MKRLRECDKLLQTLKTEVQMEKTEIARSMFFFILAGLCEIGGGYLIWLWLREGKSIWLGLSGAIVLIVYGIIPTLQPVNFGRVYAAYGGVFIVLSILWGWKVDRISPDKYDLIGGLIALIGVFIIMYWPRG
jgi:small multidrug resistance family-3 protein